MGLLDVAKVSGQSVLADQWREYFYCNALDKDVLMEKAEKRIGNKSSNTKGSDNIISNGSIIAVADGQCMIIVDQGKVVEICAEPGEFVYDTSSEPSIFAGKLGTSILDSFKTWGKRFTFGGDTAKDQRVYYFNTKEIMDNKFGTQNPVPFKIKDEDNGFSFTIDLKCNGVYSYKIVDPIAFYTNVCGNVAGRFLRSTIDNQLKTEFISALTPAFAKLSSMKIDVTTIHGYNEEMSAAVNEVLASKWSERGLKIANIAINPISLSEEDKAKLNKAQEASFYSNVGNAAGMMASAQADAMVKAADNKAGAMTGFLGMGMSMNAGGMNAGSLFQQAAGQANQQAPVQQQAPMQQAAPAVSWTCACGSVNTGKFCPNCGAAAPQTDWTCSCGQVNSGKFCSNCGSPRP